MRVILIIFLALFLFITSLFLTTIISKVTSSDAENGLSAETKNSVSNPDIANTSVTGPDADEKSVKNWTSGPYGKFGNYSADGSFSEYDNNKTVESQEDTDKDITSAEEEDNNSANNTQTSVKEDTENNAANETAEKTTDSEKDTTETETSNKPLKDGFTMQKLVYQSTRDGNDNIYSINLDGSGIQRLTDHNGNDLYPEASPDGKKIAYTSDINGIWQIVVMDWDGQNKKQITSNDFRSAYPSWSYDSKYIYFEGYLDGDWELFRIDSTGSGQERLTYNSDSHDWHPNGHPREYRIIFESGVTGHENIYIMNHDGTNISKLFNDDERRRTPDLSNSGNLITYSRYFGDNSEVYYMDFRNGQEIRVTENSGWDGHPVFSPDEKYIIFEQNTSGIEILTLFEIASGAKITVTNASSSDSDGSGMYQK